MLTKGRICLFCNGNFCRNVHVGDPDVWNPDFVGGHNEVRYARELSLVPRQKLVLPLLQKMFPFLCVWNKIGLNWIWHRKSEHRRTIQCNLCVVFKVFSFSFFRFFQCVGDNNFGSPRVTKPALWESVPSHSENKKPILLSSPSCFWTKLNVKSHKINSETWSDQKEGARWNLVAILLEKGDTGESRFILKRYQVKFFRINRAD